MVVIEHEGGFYNLYLSDTTGVYFSLSLRDVVVENGIQDVEVVRRCNTFFMVVVHTCLLWLHGPGDTHCVLVLCLICCKSTAFVDWLQSYPLCTSDQWSEWYLDC